MSGPATPSSLHSVPSTTPPSETLQHLLTLPPLLQPISPSLAALHLARVRLLLSIPTSSHNNGDIGEWWCHACGGLRQGLGGAKAKRRRFISGPGMFRKTAACTQCGAMFSRPKVDKGSHGGFSSARMAVRTRRMAEAESEENTGKGQRLVPNLLIPSASTTSTSFDHLEDHTTFESLSISNPIESTTMSPARPRPTLMSHPSLSYLPNSAPNPPTYSMPPPRARSPDGQKSGKGATKKRKRSGLAKLLAENKERAERDTGLGSWGLG